MWTMKRLELHSGCAGNPCRMTDWDLSLCPVQEVHSLVIVVNVLNQDNSIQHSIEFVRTNIQEHKLLMSFNDYCNIIFVRVLVVTIMDQASVMTTLPTAKSNIHLLHNKLQPQ